MLGSVLFTLHTVYISRRPKYLIRMLLADPGTGPFSITDKIGFNGPDSKCRTGLWLIHSL